LWQISLISELRFMAAPEIPDKLFFRIGEVCKIVAVEPFVLRFWETEFPNLAPGKSKSGHRVYKRKDIEKILQVKELLYERGYTIAGARKQLARARAPKPELDKVLIQIRKELQDILTLLRRRT
jgi:DNA-binding transcriptional MerR regulator